MPQRMQDDLRSQARAEVQRLQARKRLVYLVALAGAGLIFLLSWFIRVPGDTFIAVLYPVFAAVMAGFFLLLWRWPRLLPRLELLMLAAVAGMVLSRLVWHFHFGGPTADSLLVLAGGHYWAVALLLLATFVLLEHRPGLMVALAILLLSLLIAMTGVAGEAMRGELGREEAVYLLRVHVFLAILLALAGAATSMRDTVKDALLRAEVLDHTANTDMLTGLANRRAVEPVLHREAAAHERYGTPVALILLDIDHFKQVNDTWGHATGDAVIAGLARLLLQSVRETDFVARWGGEEFLIVAPEITLDGAWQLAERCRSALESQVIGGVQVTATFGVTAFRTGDSVDEALARADRMLYEGKRTGRNRVVTSPAQGGEPDSLASFDVDGPGNTE